MFSIIIKVPDEIKLKVFIDSHLDDDCPEPMLDVFVGMVMEGLLSFITRREVGILTFS